MDYRTHDGGLDSADTSAGPRANSAGQMPDSADTSAGQKRLFASGTG